MLKSATSRTGALGEDIACKFLERKGFKILERNYRRPWGEIDVIAERESIVHFVEVKSSSRSIAVDGSRENGSREIDYRPEEMATPQKLHKVARTAAIYMEQMRDNREYQVDVVGVLIDTEKRVARCRHFAQALEG
jgi:putative endonuclease